jgi:outer membrane lipoprotein LolB
MSANATSPNRLRQSAVRFASLVLCLTLLAACATTRPTIDLPEISTWELRQEVLGNLVDWEFRGRIAVKAGDEGFNGKFNWTQTGDRFYATVSGPLGIGTVLIEGTDDAILLTDKDGEVTALIDPEAELLYRYGWTIPVASLRYWALGIPDPLLPAETEIDEQGRLSRLLQGSWSVVISRYRENAGQEMPRTLTATNPDARVRMVIDKWIFFER